jgi:hypothetical protein
MHSKLIALLVAAGVAGAAHADLTATYGPPSGAAMMTVKIAANGDMRSDIIPGGLALLSTGGQDYAVQLRTTQPVVDRIADLKIVVGERVAAIPPDVRANIIAHMKPMKLVERGTATVIGHTGKAYFLQKEDGTLSPRPWLVISTDPALAPLAAAAMHQFTLSRAIMPIPDASDPFKELADILKTGAPIVMTGLELQSLSDAPIPAADFGLPAQPETLDQLRQRDPRTLLK